MTLTVTAPSLAPGRFAIVTPAMRRAGMLLILAAGLIVGLLATDAEATHLAIVRDGASLTRLMRFMATVKAVMALAAAASVLWRLGAAISLPRFAAYALAGAAMAAGPGLIWGMAHVGLGALLLHGGLIATILLVWRDPGASARLAEIVAGRRQAVSPG
jgi:hypothetical protein